MTWDEIDSHFEERLQMSSMTEKEKEKERRKFREWKNVSENFKRLRTGNETLIDRIALALEQQKVFYTRLFITGTESPEEYIKKYESRSLFKRLFTPGARSDHLKYLVAKSLVLK